MEKEVAHKKLASINRGIGLNDVERTALERDGCEYTDTWDPELRAVADSGSPEQRLSTPNDHVRALLERWTIDVHDETLRIGNFVLTKIEAPIEKNAA